MTDDAPAARPRGRRIAVLVAMLATAWVWLTFRYLGAVGQILAVVGPAIDAIVVVGLAVAVALARRRRVAIAVGLAGWLVAGTTMVASPRWPEHQAAPRDPVTIAAANLHFQNPTPQAAAADVVARHADVVVVSEGTRRSEPVLSRAYRYHVTSPPHRDGYSEYVASRYPLHQRVAPTVLGQAVVVEVGAPAPFLLVAVHLPRPGIGVPLLPGHFGFAAQARAVRAVRAVTDHAGMPVVVAGDLNVSDRTSTYDKLVAHRHDAMRAGWAGSTFRPFPFDLLALRIDHVIVDRSWCAAHPHRFHPTGSDHESVEVTIGPCPA